MKKVLIFGAGVAGQDVLREIKKNPDLEIEIVGFLDDNLQKLGQKVKGVKILGGRKDIIEISKNKNIDEVIIAVPSAEGEEISEIVKLCSEAQIGFKIVPRVKEIIEGHASLERIREVRVEDLLGRPVVKSDVSVLQKFFSSKTVLVTGAAGSIGAELSRQIAAYKPARLVLLDCWESGVYEILLEFERDYPKLKIEFIIANVREKKKLEKVFETYKPNYVYHAAAYKHVPLMEDNPDEAVKTNVFGSLNVAQCALAAHVERFVLVSTDKAADPKSIMGATKLITECIGRSLNGRNTKFMAVRFGNVLGSYGSVVPVFKSQIIRGGPVTVTDRRMTRYFMTIPEATQLILKAGSLGEGGEVFVLDMGEPVKILDLAKSMIRLSGLTPGKDIKIVFTGVRKGEKITEQLFNDAEALASTREDKILKTQSLGLNVAKLPELLKTLEKDILKKDGKSIRKTLAKFIKAFSA